MSHYGPQLEALFEQFDRDQIRVILYDDFRAEPLKVVRECFEFLEVDREYLPSRKPESLVSGEPRNKMFQSFLHSEHLKSLFRRVLPSALRSTIQSRATEINVIPESVDPQLRSRLTPDFHEDIAAVEHFIQRNLSTWRKTELCPRSRTPAVNPSQSRIFVGGCQRSGTTLSASLIADAAGLLYLPESVFLLEALENSNATLRSSVLRQTHMLDHWRVSLWGDEFITRRDELDRDDHPASIFESMCTLYGDVTGQSEKLKHGWVENSPRNVECSELLRQSFPDARFVHVVRDPRGVAASLLRVDFGPTTALGAAMLWKSSVLDGILAESLYPDCIHRVKYEDLVQRPESTVSQLCESLGLNVEPDWQPKGRDINPGLQQHELLLQETPVTSRLEAWRDELSPNQIADIEYIAGSAMKMLGYELTPGPIGKSTARRRYISQAFDGVNCLLWQLPLRHVRRKFSVFRKKSD